MANKTRFTIGFAWAVALAALALTACSEREPEQERPAENVLRGVAVFPLSTLRSTTGTNEALQSTFITIYPSDTVAAWYRRTLNTQGWRIVGDLKDPAGQITLHAQRDGPPLWIMIKSRAPLQGTEYTLIGAVPDTTRGER